MLQRQVSCRNATVSPLIHSRRGERIAIVPQRGQAGNVCDIETGNRRIIVTQRVTVSRDGIESATRKSEIKSIAMDFPKSTEVNSWTSGHTQGQGLVLLRVSNPTPIQHQH